MRSFFAKEGTEIAEKTPAKFPLGILCDLCALYSEQAVYGLASLSRVLLESPHANVEVAPWQTRF